MTRFIYIADTHLGARPMGYQQQKGYPERLGGILRALRDHMSAIGGVDLVLHGGDMVDSATDENILAAAEAFDMPVPVRLCLGNHDLTTPDAAGRWLALAPHLFADGATDYTVATEHCVVHVVPNHWCDAPLYWDVEQEPRLSDEQVERLSKGLAAEPHLPHIVLTHSPVWGVPAEQTGRSGPLHAPSPSFTSQMSAVVKEGNVRCVLGAHSHMNMRVDRDGVEFVTVSSLVETPFEFKLFEVGPDEIRMTTVGLGGSVGFEADYDEARGYVQGRDVDRRFSRRAAGPVR